jgi:GTP-binding protein
VGRTFVVADIPGLIEGAHEGAGLGMRFLWHIERTRLLAHLVDASDAIEHDPVHDFDVLMAELKAFNPEIAAKPMIVVGTKSDAAPEGERLARLRECAESHGRPFFAISAVTGAGITELVRAMADALDRIPRPTSATTIQGENAAEEALGKDESEDEAGAGEAGTLIKEEDPSDDSTEVSNPSERK